jgi:hypothetical protein
MTLKTTNGKDFIVDDEDASRVLLFKWSYVRNRHYFRIMGTVNGKCVPLARFILNATAGTIVDHISQDTLDNRKENLRFCSVGENLMNKSAYRKNKFGGLKGIELHGNKYRARLWAKGKRFQSIGFSTAKEAAEEYNKLALLHHGIFASLNKIQILQG